MAATAPRSSSTGRRWAGRILFSLAALFLTALLALVAFVHTDYGRGVIRQQVEAQLERSFVGGGRIGPIEGSVLGDLRLRDVVINGPDGAPAITIGTLTVDVGLRGLVTRHARIRRLIAEDVDVVLRRDERGELDIANLLRPQEPSSEPGWDVALPAIEVRRGRLALDTAGGVHHLDDVTLRGAASVAAEGSIDATVTATGTWRERAAGVALDVIVRADPDAGTARVPSLIARVGDVTLLGTDLALDAPDGEAPRLRGSLVARAPAAAVGQLVPGLAVPGDVAFTATATPNPPWTDLVVQGSVGATPVTALVGVEPERRRARGVVATGTLELARVTAGEVEGRGGALVAFDAALGRAGELPVANGMVQAWGAVAETPAANAMIAFSTEGARIVTVAGLGAPSLQATLAAQLDRAGDRLVLERATLHASTSSPARASGGLAPVRGVFRADLTARGELHPRPSLAVEGRVRGRNLRVAGASAERLELAIDATQLPRQPLGRAAIEIEELVYGERALGRLELDAANRRDGRIQVAVRSRPQRAPWLVELDALVTPPSERGVVTIELQRHHVRAGSGGDWYGSSGRVEIGPQRIALADVRSGGDHGQLALEGVWHRAGRRAGDLVAKLDATGVRLDNLGPAYRGTLDARIDVARTRGRWSGDVELAAEGIAADPAMSTLDATAKIHARADQLVVDATLASLGLGSASLALEIDAPKDVANVAAWKRLTRRAIREGELRLERVDLARLAELAGHRGLAGTLEGHVTFDRDATGGLLRVRDLIVPGLPDEEIDAVLRVAQRGSDELAPVVTGTLGRIGRIHATAQLGVPGRPFDPAAWRALGPDALRGATARLDGIRIDPALLDQLGVSSTLNGQATVAAEIGEGFRSAHLAIDLAQLRGDPLVHPIDAHLAVAVDGREANTSMVVRANTTPLVELRGRIPISLASLRANPRAVLRERVQATARLPWVPAPVLAGVFGRTEVLGGLIDGTVQIAGTVGAPTVAAQIVASNLKVPPGIGEQGIKTVERVAIDARWDGTTGSVTVDGRQQFGRLALAARGSPRALERGTLTVKASQFDLHPLLAFVPGPTSGGAGRLDADLRVQGLSPATASVRGELHLTGARVPIAPQVGTLRRAQIDVVVGQDLMTVHVTGRLGRGDVRLASRFTLAGATPMTGTAALTLRDVSPIGTVEPVIDADVKARLRREGNGWVADVVVDNGNVVVPEDRGKDLAPVGAPHDMVFATGERITERPRKRRPPSSPVIVADVTLRATYVESPEFRGIVKGKLTLSADRDEVGIVGEINADRGDVDLFGQRYLVERAGVTFDGSTDPLLDLQITHDFPEVTTITQVRGRLSDPELELTSDPGIYSQAQLLGFLLGGQPGGEPLAGSTREQITAAGTSVIANRIGGIVRDALPIDLDVLRYEAETATSSAAITVGTWLTRSLFLAYRRRLETRPDENTGEAEIQFWISRRVMLEGSVGDRGYSGVDLLWRKRY